MTRRYTALIVAVAIASTAPACTLVGMGAGAGITGIHNGVADEPDEWDYTIPMVVGASLGLFADIVLFKMLQKQWAKPWT